MNFKNILLSTAALVAGTVAANAQGPLYDKVIVDLPYAVTINNTVLQPGHYVIRQMDDAGTNSRVLMIFSDHGMKLQATALTIAALDINTPEKTSVILHHYGSDYYFDKVWIQGKNYGYEFPLPPAVKSRQREALQPYTVAASYEQTQQKDEVVQTASATQAPAAEVVQQTQTVQTDNNTVASAAPAMDNTPAPAPAPAMPHTAGEWLTMMLSGGMLSGAGLMLRKLRS